VRAGPADLASYFASFTFDIYGLESFSTQQRKKKRFWNLEKIRLFPCSEYNIFYFLFCLFYFCARPCFSCSTLFLCALRSLFFVRPFSFLFFILACSWTGINTLRRGGKIYKFSVITVIGRTKQIWTRSAGPASPRSLKVQFVRAAMS